MKKKLKDICTQVRGVSYKPSDLRDENSGVPILRANNIQDTGIVLDELVYVDSSKVHSEQYLLTDDIVICASSGSKNLVGKAATFKSSLNASFGAFCKVVRINNSDDLFKAYIQQYFQSKIYRNAISESSVGANINNIKTEDIEALEISLPSKEEQQKIAAELDTIQSVIDNKKQQLSLLDEAVKSRFIEMFGDLDCNIKTIEQTCTMKSGTTFSKDEENDSGEIFYIKVSGMNLPENDKYIKTSLSFVSRKVAGKTIIPANSIIFPKRGGAIGTNKKRITEQEICIDLNTMAVTPSNELNIQYLYQYFQNLDMGKLYNGSTVPQINNKDIGPLKIKVPPLELQQQFAAFAQQIDKSKFVIKQQIADLQELLDNKMQ